MICGVICSSKVRKIMLCVVYEKYMVNYKVDISC